MELPDRCARRHRGVQPRDGAEVVFAFVVVTALRMTPHDPAHDPLRKNVGTAALYLLRALRLRCPECGVSPVFCPLHRVRSWRESRFWLPLWGPKPSEPGCFAPVEVLEARA